MMAKPMKTLELHYPTTQFLKIIVRPILSHSFLSYIYLPAITYYVDLN